jgi:hypothetical protein
MNPIDEKVRAHILKGKINFTGTWAKATDLWFPNETDDHDPTAQPRRRRLSYLLMHACLDQTERLEHVLKKAMPNTTN